MFKGWKNKETWTVNVLLSNDKTTRAAATAWLSSGDRPLQHYFEALFEGESEKVTTVRNKAFKDFFEGNLEFENVGVFSDFALELLHTALENVDWAAIEEAL